MGWLSSGSWHGSIENRYAEHVLSGARLAGLKTATYIVLGARPEVVTTGLKACGKQADHLAFVALDCELRGLTEETLHEAIQLVQKAGHRCVIYTGSWFWEGRLDNPDWASHMPLWTATTTASQRYRQWPAMEVGASPSRSSTGAPPRRWASVLI